MKKPLLIIYGKNELDISKYGEAYIYKLSSLKIIIIGSQKAIIDIEDIEEKYSEDKVEILYKKLSLIEKIEILYRSIYCFCANYNEIQLLSSLGKKGCMINLNKKNK